MEDATAFIGEFKNMGEITEKLAGFIDATIKQTIECTSFIREYCGVGFMSMYIGLGMLIVLTTTIARLAKETFSPKAADKIKGFKDEFERLQKQRLEGAVVQNNLVSFRVLAIVQAVCESDSSVFAYLLLTSHSRR